MDRYKVSNKNNLSNKDLLEQQIRNLIFFFTKEIRKYANNFSWKDFEYVDSIKPMMPYDLYTSVCTLSPRHRELIDFIFQRINISLVKVIIEFCSTNKMKYGELMYYMKDLELLGFIDISQSTLKPMITPSFFMKSTYRNRIQKWSYLTASPKSYQNIIGEFNWVIEQHFDFLTIVFTLAD